MTRALVVDYGVGNLHSVANALGREGAEVRVSARPEDVRSADRVILPGVGAFGDGMRALRQRELDVALRDFARSGRPLLGICLGMQLLLDESEEFGRHEGLGIVSGQVRLLRPGSPHKVPHVGWTRMGPAEGRSWQNTPFASLQPGAVVYFVHSYHACPTDQARRLAEAGYGGESVCAALLADNVLGCQFHPEKSGPTGLAILREFLRW